MTKSFVKKLNLIWILILSTPIFLVALFIFRFSSSIQFQIFALAALLYLVVAIIHHFRDKTLTLEITIEYVLIAALALLILQGLIL